MLVDDRGLVLKHWDPETAAILGDTRGETGSSVVAHTLSRMHAAVRLRDWLYCLFESSKTVAHRIFVRDLGRTADDLTNAIEECFDPERPAAPITALTNATIDAEVCAMLERTERLAEEHGHTTVTEPVLTLALLESCDEFTASILASWLNDSDLTSAKERLRARILPRERREVFDVDGNVQTKSMDPTGRALLQRLVEDARSLGAPRLTTRHLLYSLLGRDGAPLRLALEVRAGIDAKKGIHAALSRELKRKGLRRNDFELTRSTLFGSTLRVLERSAAIALDRTEGLVSEADIALALLDEDATELTRLVGQEQAIDLEAVRDYLGKYRPEADDASPLLALSIAEIAERLNARICGQEQAIVRVIPWIKRLRFGLPRDGRPAAVFLLLGPTGTGKTQLAKELARYVYGSEDRLIFIEMGQFQTKESMTGLVGAPPGYVGYGEGILTNGLAQMPECVVLFDEIEKAHVQVFDGLLRFADEGVISDPAGPVRDGTRSLIVMTSNAGQRWLRDQLAKHPSVGETPTTLADQLFAAAAKELQEARFRPEFFARVDERICFLPLTEAACRGVVDHVLEREIERFARVKQLALHVTDEVRAFLTQKAHERSYEEGARAASRVINNHVLTPAIDLLLDDDRLRGRPATGLVASLHRGAVALEIAS